MQFKAQIKLSNSLISVITGSSTKLKKQNKNNPSECQVFEDTHESIIDKKAFEVVQKIRDSRRRRTPLGEMPILSGMIYFKTANPNFTK